MVAHRHLAAVAVATIVSTAVVTLTTATAAADPNDEFLAQMKSIGLDTGDQSLIGYAQAVCNVLATPGVSSAEVANAFEAGSGLTSQVPGLTPQKVDLFTAAAKQFYCPQFLN